MKLWGSLSEFCGSFLRSYRAQRAEQKLRDPVEVDNALKSAGNEAIKGLQGCIPLSDYLSKYGANKLISYLKKKDYLGSLLAIDGNKMSTRDEVCIVLLKIAVNVICNGYCVDDITSATYTIIATTYVKS